MTILTPQLRTTYEPDDGCSLTTIFLRVLGIVLLGALLGLIFGMGIEKVCDEPNVGEIEATK